MDTKHPMPPAETSTARPHPAEVRAPLTEAEKRRHDRELAGQRALYFSRSRARRRADCW